MSYRSYEQDDEYGSYKRWDRKVAGDPVTDYFGTGFNDVKDLVSGGSYSDFTASRNDAMDGWYSTIMDSVPIVRNIHNALLGRDQAKDYMENNNFTWKDMQGYNTSKLTSTISNNLSTLGSSSSRYLKNVASDLGKLYSSE